MNGKKNEHQTYNNRQCVPFHSLRAWKHQNTSAVTVTVTMLREALVTNGRFFSWTFQSSGRTARNVPGEETTTSSICMTVWITYLWQMCSQRGKMRNLSPCLGTMKWISPAHGSPFSIKIASNRVSCSSHWRHSLTLPMKYVWTCMLSLQEAFRLNDWVHGPAMTTSNQPRCKMYTYDAYL